MKINYDKIKNEVLLRLRLLEEIEDNQNIPPNLLDRLREELIIPNLGLLAEFCANIEVDTGFNDEEN